MIIILSYILGALWAIYSGVLLYYRRVVPINIYGVLLLTSILQGFFLFYDIRENIFVVQENIEPIILRSLVLICFTMTLWNKIKMNNYLTNLSKSDKNLLTAQKRTKIFNQQTTTK